MRVHFDVLGWLYIFWGILGLLTGLSLVVLASGTTIALADLGNSNGSWHPAITLLAVTSALLFGGGALMVAAGRAVVRRSTYGRWAALALGVANLIAIPFGTVLGLYTFWALLNDDARREFGRPVRMPPSSPTAIES